MAWTSLPPGFRFHPTDVELVMYYLKRKVLGKKHRIDAIAEVNIYKFSPWDLPDMSCMKSKDLEWFFFCPREKKYASGVRVKRATENGYWKTTGKDRLISYNNRTVGTVKTLIFHLGHAPKGERTDWVIHEYKILDDQLVAAGVQDTYVLCKVFKKSGLGPKNGAQYGAPFNEADWTDDDIDDGQNHGISWTSSDPLIMMPEEHGRTPVTGLLDPGSTSGLPLVEEVTSPSAGHATSEVLLDDADDELDRLLAAFTDDITLPFKENEIVQEDPSGKGKNKSAPFSDGCEIYNGLDDLDGWFQMNDGALDSLGMQNDDYSANLLSQDYSAYIELNDLLTPLTCSAGVVGTDQSSVGQITGPYINENIPQFFPEGSFTGMDQYASCATQLPVLPEGPSEGDDCLDVLQTVNNQLYRGSTAAYDLNFAARGQLDNGVNFTEHMERGTPKKICISRSIPARPPSTAARSLCCGGSSIHIKAEVTHGAGECTNEALLLMMGGSGSWWCKLPRAVFQQLWYLTYLVESDSIQVLIYCCLNETVSDSWSYCCRCLDEHSLTLFSRLSLDVNLLNCSTVYSRAYVFWKITLGLGKGFNVFGFCGPVLVTQLLQYLPPHLYHFSFILLQLGHCMFTFWFVYILRCFDKWYLKNDVLGRGLGM